MNCRFVGHSIRDTSVSVLVLSLLLNASPLFGAELSTPEEDGGALLQMTAAGIKANTDRIRTWRGEYDLTSYLLNENPWIYVYDANDESAQTEQSDRRISAERRQLKGTYIRRQQAEGEFIADLRGERLYSSCRAVGHWEYEQVDGTHQFSVPVDPETGSAEESILTGAAYLHVDQSARFTRVQGFPELPEPPGGFRIVYQESPERGDQRTRTLAVFDPRRLLESGGRSHDFILNTLSVWVQNRELAVEVTKTDDTTYRIQYDYTSGERNTETLKLTDNQLLLTDSLLEHPRRGAFHDSWEYTRHDGIIVPATYKHEHRDADGQVQHGRIATLRAIRINAPVSDADFDPSRLTAGPLDRLVDKEEDEVRLFVNSDETVAANEFRTDMLEAGTEYVQFRPVSPMHSGLTPVSQYSFRQLLIVINLLLIAVVAVMYYWQRIRATA